METTQLSGTDLTVSRLCFGNMTFGGQTGEATGCRMIDYCLDRGIQFLDTANVYNQGRAEEMLGRILAGRRNRVVLASKCRGVMGPGADESGLSRAAMFRAIDDTLHRLQTDYLDLYYLHMPDYTVPVEESLDAMDALVKAGKVRYPAISNYAAWQVAQARAVASEKRYRPIHVAQMMHNLIARGLEEEFVPFARAYDVATVVYNPLAGGLLTGKQKREAPAAGTRFQGNQMYLDRYWHPAFFDAVDELTRVAEAAGRTPVSLALNWVLHHTSAASVILGASRLEQLEQNVTAATEGRLSDDTIDACDAVWNRLRGVTPRYNR
ncbi:MAG: aldo/keto reductase [Acidobacteria bacterium]|nr:aldo/keto reductase [Acidobacteriota bacterium]